MSDLAVLNELCGHASEPRQHDAYSVLIRKQAWQMVLNVRLREQTSELLANKALERIRGRPQFLDN
jgi:hypothetical protein